MTETFIECRMNDKALLRLDLFNTVPFCLGVLERIKVWMRFHPGRHNLICSKTTTKYMHTDIFLPAIVLG